MAPPEGFPDTCCWFPHGLHDWQRSAFFALRARLLKHRDEAGRLEMLVEVCTGAGKSLLAQMFMVETLLCTAGQYKRVIVIIPKNNALREQWTGHCRRLQQFFEMDLEIFYMDDPKLQDTRPEDVAVVDECHHVCRDKRWGLYTSTCNACGVFLLLSATPWHGRNQMAFQPETIYTYKYQQAETDEIVRHVKLRPQNAEVRFTLDGQEQKEVFFHQADRANELEKRPDSLRYAAASKMSDDFEDADGIAQENDAHQDQLKLCQALVDRGVTKLRQVQRNCCSKAQGLIFAYDAIAMDEIASYMKSYHDIKHCSPKQAGVIKKVKTFTMQVHC